MEKRRWKCWLAFMLAAAMLVAGAESMPQKRALAEESVNEKTIHTRRNVRRSGLAAKQHSSIICAAPESRSMNANVVKIDASNLYGSNGGVFQGWGTSLCWFGNRIGASEKTSNEAAKFLCNQEEGLGLNIIRFNIGGGDDPSHDHITRTEIGRAHV